MPLDRFKAVPAVYLLLIKDNKILLTRRQNTGFMDGYYMVPSGHVEEGEFPTNAMIREAKEEVGIDIQSSNLEFVHFLYRQKTDPTGERVDIFFVCKKWSDDIKNMEPDKCDEVGFYDMDNLPEKTVPYLKAVLKNYQKGVSFLEI